MRKKLITILVISVLMLSGCKNNNSINEVEEVETTKISKSYEQELYEIYQTIYPKIKDIFEEYQLNIEELNYIDHRYYSGPQQMIYNKSNKGIISYVNYELEFKNENNPTRVYTNIIIDTDKEELVNGFNLENSIFGEINKVVIDEYIDYNELNKQIYNACSNLEDLNITKKYNNITFNLKIENNKIEYELSIYPTKK